MTSSASSLGQVLAERGQDRGDALRLQLAGRAQRIVDLLARHEARHRPPHEAVLVAWSRSQALVEPASRAFRIRLMSRPIPLSFLDRGASPRRTPHRRGSRGPFAPLRRARLRRASVHVVWCPSPTASFTGRSESDRRPPAPSRRSCSWRHRRAGTRRRGRTRPARRSGRAECRRSISSSPRRRRSPCFLPLISSSCRTRSVSIRPGMIWLTRIFEVASSSASVLASAETDARSTVESPRFGIGSLTDDEVDMRIAPPPRACIDGTAARTMRSALNSSRSAASCQARSSNDSAAPAGGPPELVISRSMPPKRSLVAAAQRWMPSADLTSTARREHVGAARSGTRRRESPLRRATRSTRARLRAPAPARPRSRARGSRRRPSRPSLSVRDPCSVRMSVLKWLRSLCRCR